MDNLSLSVTCIYWKHRTVAISAQILLIINLYFLLQINHPYFLTFGHRILILCILKCGALHIQFNSKFGEQAALVAFLFSQYYPIGNPK
jgi:hypothetical protein